MKASPLAAALALLAACAPDRPAPVDVVALVYDPTAGRYTPQQVQLQTPTDIVAMTGPLAEVIGGARFELDPSDPALINAGNDAEKIRAAMTKEEGGSVKVSYIDQSGVLVPADFHSLNIVTSYYNIERSFSLFEKIGGLTAQEFGKREIFYFPELVMYGETITDNALFFPPMQAFMILPFDKLQSVPMALNLGVVGHELTHAVINHQIFGSDPFPSVYVNWYSDMFPTPGLNLVSALDEGIADLFGTAITCSDDFLSCDTGFLGHSAPEEIDAERRLDNLHCMTSGLHDALLEQNTEDFKTRSANNYLVGSVLASALWKAAEETEVVQKLGVGEARRQMLEGVYKSMGGKIQQLIADAGSEQADFRLESGAVTGVLEVIAGSMTDPTLQAAVCGALLDRFGLSLNQIKSCPATARSFGECSK